MGSLGFGVVGAGWMGHVHARAVARFSHHYPDLGVTPVVVAVTDPLADQVRDFCARHGQLSVHKDWRDLISDPAVHVVSVTAPNAFHCEIGVAAAEAGKHLWIEKPVGIDADDARTIDRAVTAAGVHAVVGFNYRNFPVVERARQLISGGEVGEPTHAYVRTLSDYASHPGGTLSWRYSVATGGHGILADLGSHGFDLIRYLLGDIKELVADTATFIPRRPVAVPGSSHFAVVDVEDPSIIFGDVENEDYVTALLRMSSGARVLYEAGRTSVGDQCTYGFTVHGSKGQVSWDFRRSDELAVSVGASYQGQSTEVVFGSPGDGEYERFQPGAGIAVGYDDSKVIELARLIAAISTNEVRGATIRDAIKAAEATEAALESVQTGRWVEVANSVPLANALDHDMTTVRSARASN